MITIAQISATEILDSRGIPTIETYIKLSNGIEAIASVPSGASRGTYEAVELRDGDATRYMGLGVLKAVNHVNTIIAPRLIGLDPVKQGEIDQLLLSLDGTERKARLGGNALISVSTAVCKVAAKAVNLPLYTYVNMLLHGGTPTKLEKLPTPIFNLINGGKHGAGNLEFQEFQLIPATIKSFHEALQMGVEVYHQLRDILISRNAIYSVGDEGGFAPNLRSNSDALEALMEAIRHTKFRFGMEVFLGLDIAASHLLIDHKYRIKDQPVSMTSEEFLSYLVELHRSYRILLLEDPLGEDDWENWSKLVELIGREVHVIADDLVVTNPTRLKKAIDSKACSAIIVKPNQVGTISETLAVIKTARSNDLKILVSHRSGETNDDFIADFSVGVGADYFKAGAPARGERVAKYNRMLKIEQQFNKKSG